METPAVPSFHSATILVQHHAAAAMTAVVPWRSILAVEPDSSVLSAKALLLTKANYCVTPATGLGDLFSFRDTKAIALAMLSDRLGQRLLGTVAATARRQWPGIRILIVGQVPIALDDYLYDEHICRSSDPQQVLADLEWLYEGMVVCMAAYIDCPVREPIQPAPQPRTPAPNKAPKRPGMAS